MGVKHPNVTNSDELEWAEGPKHGDKFASKTKRLGTAAGGKRIGCSLYEVEPGKRAFPMHAHLANEEAIYVLDGEGTLRIGDRKVKVTQGDYVALPAGPACAHQLINSSEEPLRYLCMSTTAVPDVGLYTDSDKIGVLGGDVAPIRLVFKRADGGTAVSDYFEGEESES